MEGLHKAIATDLVNQDARLSGKEFRFLRKELGLSQRALAQWLEVDEQTVANAEKSRGKRPISKSADVLLRALYLESIKRQSPVTRMLKRINELDNERSASFTINRGRWGGVREDCVA